MTSIPILLKTNQSSFLSWCIKKMIGHWLDAISFIIRSIVAATASCGGTSPDNLVLVWNVSQPDFPPALMLSISPILPVLFVSFRVDGCFFTVAGCSRNPYRIPRPSSCYDMELLLWRGHSMTYIWLRRPNNRFTFVDHPSLSRLRAATRRFSGSGSVWALAYINTWLCHLGVGCSITGSPEKRLGS